MNVLSLNCPNCGAGVASDSSQCQFCKTRLKTMGCPSCFGQIFVGSKFCEHCGAIAVPTNLHEGSDLGDCPRCNLPLGRLEISSTSLGECEKCDGLWADSQTFESICADSEKQSAVLGFIGVRTTRVDMLTKINYVRCPDCGEMMNRSNFARSSGVIVDICRKHGVWFDADELPKIVGFIKEGGMEIVRNREKMELESERSRLRDEQRKLGMSDMSLGIGGIFENEDNSGIRNFVRNLFD